MKKPLDFPIRKFVRDLSRQSSIIFLREWYNHPKQVGAILPSSSYLAQRLAHYIDLKEDGLIIELGAGTGKVTQAILDAGVPPERLIVIEYSPHFIKKLSKKFPNLTIIEADAAKLSAVIPEGQKINSIVSGLPLRSLPKDKVKEIINEWHQVLNNVDGQCGKVIQFTYDLRKNVRDELNRFSVKISSIVWKNVPPARVTCYQLIN